MLLSINFIILSLDENRLVGLETRNWRTKPVYHQNAAELHSAIQNSCSRLYFEAVTAYRNSILSHHTAKATLWSLLSMRRPILTTS